jgi:hypothetical protein
MLTTPRLFSRSYQNLAVKGVFLQPQRRHNLPPEAQRKVVKLMALLRLGGNCINMLFWVLI